MKPTTIHGFSAMGIAIVLIPLLSSAQDGLSVSCTTAPVEAELGFTLKDMNGADVTLSDYADNVILLDFWATWCAPCRIEIPGFIEMVGEYGDRGLVVLGVSIDDAPDALQLYAEELGMNYPVLIGDGRDDIKTSYGPLIGFPTSFIIDRNGTICHKHTGYAPKEAFVREIEALL
jgi:thiol-disulfide isomerase/thioredoxin